jgi:predicted amidohydrolase
MPPDLDSIAAMKELAAYTPKYIELFKQQATKYGIYIIAGSQPVLREGKLYNVAHLFTPAGNVYTQDKLHITPAERQYFNINPGEGINVFDTPLARIGIQVCYDIEFPEVTRLIKKAGADIIFVPFSTDERKAYYRVRFTAQARAVENVMYVVISGNVGNLPNIKSYLINYGQPAIFTRTTSPFRWRPRPVKRSPTWKPS